MGYELNEIETPVVVSQIVNLNYFDKLSEYISQENLHSFCKLLYVDAGKIYVESDSFAGYVSGGECVVHPSDETHRFQCVPGVFSNLIILGFECKNEELCLIANRKMTLSDDQKKQITMIIKEAMSLYLPPYDVPDMLQMKKRDKYPFGAEQMIKIQLERLLIEFLRESSHEELSQVKRNCNANAFDICQYIDEHYKEKITLDNLCFVFGTNRTSLCKAFKEKHGMTVVEYIQKKRIAEAKKLLHEGKLTIGEIAEQVGFSSENYFYRVFKLQEKESPRDYTDSVKIDL